MNKHKYDIKYNEPIKNWDEALPLGNGKLGCLIYGENPVRFSLDRVDLWDERPNPTIFERGFNFKNCVKLVKSGTDEDWEERSRLFDKIFIKTAYPTKLTAGRVELTPKKSNGKATSGVDITTATAYYKSEFLSFESFVCAEKDLVCVKTNGEYEIDIHIPDYISLKDGRKLEKQFGNSLENRANMEYPISKVEKSGDFTFYKQKTFTDFSYGLIAYRKGNELYLSVALGEDDGEFMDKAKAELVTAAELGYTKLKAKHEKWWKKYWSKSEISVGDELFDKTYYRSQYLFASCSRKGSYPMPLQGVWTADNDKLPPWKGDYHHDTNTELSYQHYLKANRLSEGEVFVDYLWNMRKVYKKFAKDFFGVNGILLPSCSSLGGVAMGGWGQYSLSPTMTIWAAQSFDEYYKYTGNESFLKNRAYPFLKEVGEAIFGLLEEKNGKLYLPLSSSPEINDNTRASYLEPNSNFDLALMRYLYKTLCEYSNILGKDGEKYAKILSKLDEIAIKDNKIMLDKTQMLTESHRHFSHLMCLYPLHLINYDTEEHKKIYEATIFDLERYGTGMWVGFSFAMSAQIYAMAHNGNSAYEKLRAFCKGFVAENGFHLNGDFKRYGYTTFHYRPFTLESSFGFCDALQEMLLQDHQGYIELFSAIPKEWDEKTLFFRDLRSIGGILVSAKRTNGKVEYIKLKATKPTKVKIKDESGEIIEVELKEGINIIKG